MFKKYERPKTIPTNPGTRYINTYQEEINDSGKLVLVKVGEENVWEKIQKDKETVKIENILAAVARGDLSALQQREIAYMDATTMPKNLMEVQNEIIKFKQEFYDLPLEVRKLFDNSPEQYVSEMGTKEGMEKLAPYNEKIAKIQAEKNMKEYEKKVAEGAKLNYDIAKEQARLEGTKNE